MSKEAAAKYLLDRVTIDRDGCFNWVLGRDRSGYGRPGVPKAFVDAGYQIREPQRFAHAYAHRLSYWLFRGELDDSLDVCHHCDNPSCINPAHLYLATPKKNIADCIARGRICRGESHPKTPLTELDVRDIRAKAANGAGHRELAREYGICHRSIGNIIHRCSWRHVDQGRDG